MIVQNIGSFKDLTYERLLSNSDFSSYDNDSPLKLRKLIQKVFALPLLGRLFVFVFKNFFILQTLSKKNNKLEISYTHKNKLINIIEMYLILSSINIWSITYLAVGQKRQGR